MYSCIYYLSLYMNLRDVLQPIKQYIAISYNT